MVALKVWTISYIGEKISNRIFFFSVESDENEEEGDKDGIKKEGAGGASLKQEKDAAGTGTTSATGEKKDGISSAVKTEKELKEAQRMKELKIAESEAVRDLKAQLK